MELKEHLTRSLPDYMIPAFFVYLDKIPLTSNGKIDRKALPTPDLSLRQVSDEYVAPQSEIERELASIWTEVLGIERIGIYDNFFRIGGDSIISIQVVSKARVKGIHFAVKDIFNCPTIVTLSLVAKTEQQALIIKPEQGLVKGDIPLTPIQHWFFEQNLSNRNHYNQAMLLQTRGSFNSSLLKNAFELLIIHHDVLRCRYMQDDIGVWKQVNLTSAEEDIASICTTIDLTNLSTEELSVRIEQESVIIQQSLNTKNGPLVRFALFDCGPKEPTRLLIVIHHLVVDGVSWRILLEDLENVYEALNNNKISPLLPKTHSYQQWSYALESYAKSKELKEQSSYWQKIMESMRQFQLPMDFDKVTASDATFYSNQIITLSLTVKETAALLQRVPKAYRTQINDILLTSLTLAIGDWTQNYSIGLSLEGHGRESINSDIDISRTIGWFTSIFPIYLKIDNPKDLGEAIKTIKEELRNIPEKGIGYGILSYLTKHLDLALDLSYDSNALSSSEPISLPSALSHPSLSFNYLGQWDNMFSHSNLFNFASESIGSSSSENNTNSYLLNINAEVKQEVFSISFDYNSNYYKQETIDKVARAFISRLKQIIEHCTSDNVFGYTASDFASIDLSQVKIVDEIINKK